MTTSQTLSTTTAAFNNINASIANGNATTATTTEDEISKKLPKEILLRILSYLDVVSLCRCAQVISSESSSVCDNHFFLSIPQVSKYWNILALDGSNWQKIDLFYFQLDIEVK